MQNRQGYMHQQRIYIERELEKEKYNLKLNQ